MKRISSLILLVWMASHWLQAQPTRPYAHGLFLGIRTGLFPAEGTIGWLNEHNTSYLDANDQQATYYRSEYHEIQATLGYMALEGRLFTYLDMHLGLVTVIKGQIPNRTRRPLGIGFQYYPWPAMERMVMPWIGLALHQYDFSHTDPGSRTMQLFSLKSSMDLGVRYMFSYGFMECGVNMLLNNQIRTAYARDRTEITELAPFQLHGSVGWYLPYRTIQEKYGSAAASFSESTLGGIYFAGGTATAIPLHTPWKEHAPFSYLPGRPLASVHRSLAFGYQLPGFHARLEGTHRDYTLVRESLGFRQEARRAGWGFWLILPVREEGPLRPFGGVGYQLDRLREKMTDNGEVLADRERRFHRFQIRGGLTLHPGTARNDWYLRTQVRYSPFAETGSGLDRVPYDHLEWDMVQLVWHPFRSRWKG